MTMTAQTEQPLRLSFRSEQQVVIESDNEDRFLMTSQEAARACKQIQDRTELTEDWKVEFDKFLSHLHAWSLLNSDEISACYVIAGTDGIEVFFETVGPEYRDAIDDNFTQLDFELVDKFPKCPCETMHFPDTPGETRYSFFPPDKALLVYGH